MYDAVVGHIWPVRFELDACALDQVSCWVNNEILLNFYNPLEVYRGLYFKLESVIFVFFLSLSLYVKYFRFILLSVVPALCSLSPPFCLPFSGGRVMFNACSLCCTQRRRMGSSPLISNKRPLETRQARHRSTSSEVWNDVDIDVCPGPSTVSNWASHQQGASCLE